MEGCIGGLIDYYVPVSAVVLISDIIDPGHNQHSETMNLSFHSSRVALSLPWPANGCSTWWALSTLVQVSHGLGVLYLS